MAVNLTPALSASIPFLQGTSVKLEYFAQRSLPVMGRGPNKLFFSGSGGTINVSDALYFDDSVMGGVAIPDDDGCKAIFSDDGGRLQTRFSYEYTGFTWGLTDIDPGSYRYPDGSGFTDASGKFVNLAGKFIPWHDKNKFNAVQYLTNSSSMTFPVVNDDPAALDPLDYNGVIEPLIIRTAVGMSSTFMGDNLDPEPHQTRGAIGGMYAQEPYNRFTLITEFYDIKDSNRNYPFCYTVDWRIYENFAQFVPDSAYTSNDDIKQTPFVERTIAEIAFENVIDKPMRDYLMYHVHTASIDDRPTPTSKTLPRGWVYENCVFGSDSLAFGGLLK